MPDTIRSVDYFYVRVPDQPGEGVKLLAALKGAGVNMLGFSGFPTGGGKAQIDLIPEDAEALRQVVTRQGFELSDRKRAFLVQGDDRVGAVADVVDKLATKKISIVASQAVSAGAGRWGMIVWVKPNDYQQAREVLGA